MIIEKNNKNIFFRYIHIPPTFFSYPLPCRNAYFKFIKLPFTLLVTFIGFVTH